MKPSRRQLLPLTLALATLTRCGAVQAQAHGSAAPPQAPPREAAQFDFLLGQWELEVSVKAAGGLAALLHGTPRLAGMWKAWRALDGFGIEDELRIVDTAGNPVAFSHSLRAYDARQRRWSIVSMDAYRARPSQSVATWQDGEMRGSGSGSSADGKPVQTRTRFFEIGGERFRMRQDRSLDDGASWDEAVLAVQARRLAAKAPR